MTESTVISRFKPIIIWLWSRRWYLFRDSFFFLSYRQFAAVGNGTFNFLSSHSAHLVLKEWYIYLLVIPLGTSIANLSSAWN